MKFERIKTNLSLLQKIALSGVLIALITILQKIIAINYIPGFMFLRISFGGPALIIFSSILLGPWFGLLIGGASDLLGYFVFDMSGLGWMPQVTVIYCALGFFSYFVFVVVKNIKKIKIISIIEFASFAIFFIGILLYMINNNSIDMWQKILWPILVFVLSIVLFIFIFIFNKKITLPKGYNLYQISLCSFLVEVLVLLLFGSLMKALAFGFDIYFLIFICQLIVTFVNVTIDTILLSILLRITNKYFC